MTLNEIADLMVFIVTSGELLMVAGSIVAMIAIALDVTKHL